MDFHDQTRNFFRQSGGAIRQSRLNGAVRIDEQPGFPSPTNRSTPEFPQKTLSEPRILRK